MVFEQHALRFGEGGGEIGRHQLAEALATENAVGSRVGGVRGGVGISGAVGTGDGNLAGETRPDPFARRIDGTRIDVLIPDGGDGLLESLFGLHDASPMRRVISLRRR